jgi:hypothetical protein
MAQFPPIHLRLIATKWLENIPRDIIDPDSLVRQQVDNGLLAKETPKFVPPANSTFVYHGSEMKRWMDVGSYPFSE